MEVDMSHPLTIRDFNKSKPGDILPITRKGLNEDRFLIRFEGVESTPEGTNILCSFNDTGRVDDWSDVGPYLYEFEGVVCVGSGADSLYRLF
jgi:hypothetical protein